MKIDFNTIDRGEISNYPKASQLIINSTKKWIDFWQQHSSEAVPQINFEKDLVVAVVAGEKPTSSYSVEVIGVDNTDSQVTITATYGQPRPEVGIRQIITNPYHIIQISQLT